jgi:hypothetical protein
MSDKQTTIQTSRDAFGANAYPGDAYLQGSTEGTEPYEEIGPFHGKTDWQKLDAAFLDAHAAALSFFSEAGFRFFLPAYLVADLQDQLKSADPSFALTSGFSDFRVDMTVGGRHFVAKAGKSELLNPRRYGAATSYDYARYRLSIFTREEAASIVAYLECKRDSDIYRTNWDKVDIALNAFWRERSTTAPTGTDLWDHLNEKAAFVAALREASGSQ